MPRLAAIELLAAHSNFLRASELEQSFTQACWKLMETIRPDVTAAFGDIIADSSVANHWGRIGVECELKLKPIEQWVFFGTYIDTSDHGIPFKTDYQAEFAVFFDMNPNYREQVAAIPGIGAAIDALRARGFEFNFPQVAGNSWRMCYWREPMQKISYSAAIELVQLFKERLRTLFGSTFFKLVGGTAV